MNKTKDIPVITLADFRINWRFGLTVALWFTLGFLAIICIVVEESTIFGYFFGFYLGVTLRDILVRLERRYN